MSWLKATVDGLSLENERLRRALGLKTPPGRHPVWVHVLERDPQHWYGSVGVDAGADRGVSLNDPVLGRKGDVVVAVGRVIEVHSDELDRSAADRPALGRGLVFVVGHARGAGPGPGRASPAHELPEFRGAHRSRRLRLHVADERDVPARRADRPRRARLSARPVPGLPVGRGRAGARRGRSSRSPDPARRTVPDEDAPPGSRPPRRRAAAVAVSTGAAKIAAPAAVSDEELPRRRRDELLRGACLFVAAMFLQWWWNAHFAYWGAAPQFLFALTVVIAARRGPVTAMLIGYAWGLFSDTLRADLFGADALLYALAGYAAGMVRRQIDLSAPGAARGDGVPDDVGLRPRPRRSRPRFPQVLRLGRLDLRS